MIQSEIETSLENLPDEVSTALVKWRTATLDREKCEALLYLKFKGEGTERTATEIKAMVHANDERYRVVLAEAMAEAAHNRLLERLLAAKVSARLRTAF